MRKAWRTWPAVTGFLVGNVCCVDAQQVVAPRFAVDTLFSSEQAAAQFANAQRVRQAEWLEGPSSLSRCFVGDVERVCRIYLSDGRTRAIALSEVTLVDLPHRLHAASLRVEVAPPPLLGQVVPYVLWMHRSEVAGGDSTHGDWQRLAETREPVDCTELSCWMVFERAGASETRERAMMECEVAYRKGDVSPIPRVCETIAVSGEMGTWIRTVAGWGDRNTARTRGLEPRATVFGRTVLDALIRNAGALTVGDALGVLESVFADRPMSLRTTFWPLGDPRSVQGMRTDQLSNMYARVLWEAVEVEGLVPGENAAGFLPLRLDLTLFLSTRNTAHEYRPPSEEEFSTYADSLLVYTRRGFSLLCGREWRSGNIFECRP